MKISLASSWLTPSMAVLTSPRRWPRSVIALWRWTSTDPPVPAEVLTSPETLAGAVDRAVAARPTRVMAMRVKSMVA